MALPSVTPYSSGIGVALNKTIQTGANTSLYGAVPSLYIEYSPRASFSLEAGKLATLIGPENTFTYQNPNIQRGIIWYMETAVSRGIRGTFTGSKFNGALEINDGFYSGSRLGAEAQITNMPSARTTLELAVVVPNANAPANATASIANKRLYNAMLTYTTGRWTFSPYLLFVESPSSAAIGYKNSERAFGAVFNTAYAFNSSWSLPLRIEYGKDGSMQSDTSSNADLLGYGPGSGAWTYTLTPSFRRGVFFARVEASDINAVNFTPGTAFGTNGAKSSQFRTGVEAGLQF